jgi:DNA helicase-2/ATP-dependent DNA helicase PcrA
VSALRQFSIDPRELLAAMKSLPYEVRGSLAAVLPKVGGGKELLQIIAEARVETDGKNVYGAFLVLLRTFQIPRTQAIEAVLQFANQWERSPITESGSPAEFLEYLAYFREAGGVIALPASDREDSVKLMSAHSAKGLEFTHVFILRAKKGSFPTNYKESLIEIPRELRNSGLVEEAEKKIHEQEERRLFYVAMTRARDTLTIYGPFGSGEKEKTPPGFLRELMKDRHLRDSLTEVKCREFQTAIFAQADAPAISRAAEWVAMPAAWNLSAALSASAIQRYETCPLQFKLEREWRIPGDASAAMQYGASMHRVLLTYYDSVRWERTLTDEEVIERFRADLNNEGITDRYQHELYERQGIEQLKEFLSDSRHAGPEVLHTEERFTVKIGDTTLAGRIDRIDRAPGGGVIVVDYKTGRPQTQEDADESLQLSIYALAAREKWGYRAEELVLHNLNGNAKVRTHRSEMQLEADKVKVRTIAEKIAAGQFEAKPGFQCASCPYRVLCPKTEKRMPEVLAKPASARN